MWSLSLCVDMCIRVPCEPGNSYCFQQPVSIRHRFIALPANFDRNRIIYKIQTEENPKYDYYYRMPRGNRGQEFRLVQKGPKASIKMARSLVGPLDYMLYIYMEIYLKDTSRLIGEYLTKLYVNISPHDHPFV
ncbi:uncharacterized protein LOC121410991 [Lytechinus variegatus]|uniref:uncharacterized protein LOC121410991 n=1 Tax=Lytechinus variegatus TaxID=7654 RepID=UPI001BB1B7FF|nr:uncharacterized protein LOC121410991 [Lytechinus variegatus]